MLDETDLAATNPYPASKMQTLLSFSWAYRNTFKYFENKGLTFKNSKISDISTSSFCLDLKKIQMHLNYRRPLQNDAQFKILVPPLILMNDVPKTLSIVLLWLLIFNDSHLNSIVNSLPSDKKLQQCNINKYLLSIHSFQFEAKYISYMWLSDGVW